MKDQADEQRLMREIMEARDGPYRNSLIDQLDATPVQNLAFWERWLVVHSVKPFQSCWSERGGFDPSKSRWSREVQILAATDYAKSEVYNGGFLQLFYNSTGVLAPEMVEFLSRSGLEQAASVAQEAISTFGAEYPRSQTGRSKALAALPGSEYEGWDPFNKLDTQFYHATKRPLFDRAANNWLKETCGIERLGDVG